MGPNGAGGGERGRCPWVAGAWLSSGSAVDGLFCSKQRGLAASSSLVQNRGIGFGLGRYPHQDPPVQGMVFEHRP